MTTLCIYKGKHYFYFMTGSSSCFPKLVENMKPKFLYVPLFYHHVEGPNYLSNKLQLICWSCYPANSIASFQPMKLVALRLHRRLQEQL
uniref:Uncharacterized protein n=1 Tax=Lactuca sativa TaxID=4236 RepID=A0A9R1WXY6_LACSA|nr:hypothetical protein LSAT_V11C800409090 [Lactuca sativa]